MEHNFEYRRDQDDEGVRVSPPKQNPYIMPFAIVVAGALIASAVLYANQDQQSTLPSKIGNAAALNAPRPRAIVSGNLADDDPFLGNPDAPVTIVEFGDFQCPFCGKFFNTTEQDIIDTYVKTGKARLVYRDFPLTAIHEEAQKSAEAAECANEQGKFWPYHDLLFSRQDSLSVKNYKAWARELKLNTGRFNQCLDSDKYAPEIEKDLADGEAAGVSGTPGSFINGRIAEGALPFEDYKEQGRVQPGFRTIIEEELKKVSR